MGASHNLDSLKPKPFFLWTLKFPSFWDTHQIWAQWFSVFFCCTSPCNTDLADHVTGSWISFRNYWDVSTKWMKQGRKKLGVVYVSRSERALVIAWYMMKWPHATPSVINFVEFPQRWPRCQIIWRGLKNHIFGVFPDPRLIHDCTSVTGKFWVTTNSQAAKKGKYDNHLKLPTCARCALNTEKETSSWVRKTQLGPSSLWSWENLPFKKKRT